MKKLDKYSYHEALDRSYCVAKMIEEMLTTHPVVKKHKKIRKKIEKAQVLILDAYQMIGSISIPKK